MIPLTDSEWRRAFSTWLRTGDVPTVLGRDGTERKFNPWHDPDDGRFTFAGRGVYYGDGASGSGGGSKRTVRSGSKRRARGSQSGKTSPRGSGFGGGGASGSWEPNAPPKRSSGGSFGGGGASGTWEEGPKPKRSAGGSFGGGGASGSWKPEPAQKPTSGETFRGRGASGSWESNAQRKPSSGGSFGGGGATGSWNSDAPSERLSGGGSFGGGGASGSWTPEASEKRPSNATGSGERFRTVSKGGYTYEIDSLGRTRRVSGELTLTEAPVRSRSKQARAGGTDRRPSDDGGHYIAARFNGPTDAFNHFAQDANFNRGGYRVLEEQWARAKQAGKSVTVTIVPYYNGSSTRPREIDVWFVIDGHRESQKFPNERSEKRRGK